MEEIKETITYKVGANIFETYIEAYDYSRSIMFFNTIKVLEGSFHGYVGKEQLLKWVDDNEDGIREYLAKKTKGSMSNE